MTRSKKRTLPTLAALSALVAAIVVALVLLLGGDDDQAGGSVTAQNAAGTNLPQFTLGYPENWERVDVSAGPGDDPRATIQRKDGKAVITLTIHGPVDQDLADMKRDVVQEIRTLKGATEVGSREVDIAAGPALLTTWKMKDTGRIQSSLVVPAGKHSFLLDAVVRGDRKVAGEVGDIYSAFETK